MILARFVISGLIRRWGSALLTLLIGSLGLMGLILILWSQTALPEAVKSRISETDMVVGPKSSGLDLALCCALHLSPSTGLISAKSVIKRLKEPDLRPYIRATVPIALGDNYQGRRIVWTTPDIIPFYKASLQSGKVWSGPLEMVVGSEVAASLNLSLGQRLKSSHGLGEGGDEHEAEYLVTAILKPTGGVLDHLLLSDLSSIARVHDHSGHDHGHEDHDHEKNESDTPDRVNAVLVRFSTPIAQAAVPLRLNEEETLSATSPRLELAKLMSLARPLIGFVTMLSIVLALIAAIVMTLTLVQSLNQRAKDMSLLRFLGATRRDLVFTVSFEALILGHLAFVAGFILALIGQGVIRNSLSGYGLDLSSGLNLSIVFYLYLAMLALAALSTCVPMLRLYLTRDDEGFKA
jgi:putative ABC transport system permease protein